MPTEDGGALELDSSQRPRWQLGQIAAARSAGRRILIGFAVGCSASAIAVAVILLLPRGKPTPIARPTGTPSSRSEWRRTAQRN